MEVRFLPGELVMSASKEREEMGEEAWAEYQKERKRSKSSRYYNTKKGLKQAKLNSFRVAECRRNNKMKLVEYKGGKCEVCGYNKPIPGAYNFHHIDPNEKDFGVSTMTGMSRGIKKLKKEVDKCMLVCSVCHAEIHHAIEQTKLEQTRKELIDAGLL